MTLFLNYMKIMLFEIVCLGRTFNYFLVTFIYIFLIPFPIFCLQNCATNFLFLFQLFFLSLRIFLLKEHGLASHSPFSLIINLIKNIKHSWYLKIMRIYFFLIWLRHEFLFHIVYFFYEFANCFSKTFLI